MSSSDEFFSAIRAGDAARVEELMQGDPALAVSRDGNVSALLVAAYHGQQAIARAIAERRQELSLCEACAIGDEGRALRHLAADPSSLDTPGGDGHFPVSLAIFFRHPGLARKLIEAGADVSLASRNEQRVAPLHAAVAVRDHDTLRLLLEHGADPNARQQLDYVPLHTAAGRGDREAAELLVAHGAARNLVGSDGKSPADLAREQGHEEFAAWLAAT